jgi:uncharacterized tannase-like protein DUF6351
MRIYWSILAALLFCVACSVTVVSAADHKVDITTVSSRPDIVSGGDVLVRITTAPGVSTNRIKVKLNGRDVTDAFRQETSGSLLGLVKGLKLGHNQLVAIAQGGGAGEGGATSLDLTNWPIAGPIFSGPQIEPYRCMTDQFILPDGSYLGPSADAQCSGPTKVQYVYRSTSGQFLPMADLTKLPADIVMVTTTTGATVPYVVRFEAGTIDRGVYNIAILHDPTTEPEPSPFVSPKGWAKKLMWVHGFGCAGGWYYQGTETGSLDGYDISQIFSGIVNILPRTAGIGGDFNVMNNTWLSKGYAVATSTLNHPSISCNPHLAGEATDMVKEHFIKEFGPPLFTASTGGSGGAYSSEQIADAFPGLFDGILVNAVFPDSLSIGLSGADGHLLTHYFAVTDPTGFTDAQKIAVSGYKGVQALIDAANQAGRTDPVPNRADIPGYLSAVWYSLGGAWPILYPTPPALRYDPLTNPKGARPTIFDVSRAVYGTELATGFALRPIDNVGVQYGLAALNSGAITKAQFLKLNVEIGGFDHDANYVSSRTLADEGAVKRTYESGLSLGGGGLASIPVFDFGSYNDTSGYHYQWFHFAVRERLIEANGNADNQVMWRGAAVPAATAAALFDQWMTAYKTDTSNLTQIQKVLRDKPAMAVDGCWSNSTTFIAEPQTFSSQPNSVCNSLFPSYAAPRLIAGGPLAGNVLKCQLKPIDPNDYKVAFTSAEMAQLQAIFPTGVCDWSKPGVNQVGVVTWASFGPLRDNLVFDVTRQYAGESDNQH